MNSNKKELYNKKIFNILEVDMLNYLNMFIDIDNYINIFLIK